MKSSRSSITNPEKAWILVDEGNSFLETQCLAVVEAIDIPAHLFRVSMDWYWKYIPSWLMPDVMDKVCVTPKPLAPSLPSFVVCGGEMALILGMNLRKKHHAFTVAFGPAPTSFHKIILESHFQGEKKNKIHTLGPLHRIHPESLIKARQTFYRAIDHLPKPRLSLLIGSGERLEPLVSILNLLYKKSPFSLMIYGDSLSEDTVKYLSYALHNLPHFLWDGQGEDPYLGFLAHSEAIILNNASSLMLAEANSVGQPVFIYPSHPLSSFAQILIQRGSAILLSKDVSLFSHTILPPLQETQRVAQILKRAYEERLL